MLAFAIIVIAYSVSMAWLFCGGMDYIEEFMRRTK